MPAQIKIESDPMVAKVATYMRAYMSQYDSSHDFTHIRRVVGLANHLADNYLDQNPPLNRTLITLAAFLHDVGDRKYHENKPNSPDAATLITSIATTAGYDQETAAAVAEICLAVSWSKEVENPDHVAEVLARRPELGIVQDADRLDALGAIGAGRCFSYGAAKTKRGMQGCLEHFDEKLFNLEGKMKTDMGRRMARERTERLKTFKKWWDDEAGYAVKDD